MNSNDGIQALDSLGISYRISHFTRDLTTAAEVASELGIALAGIAKAMVVKIEGVGFGLAVVPGDVRVNTAAVAQAFGSNSGRLASRREAIEATGIPVGAISPIAVITRKNLFLVADRMLLAQDEINISSGNLRIGLMVKSEQLFRKLQATIAEISESK